MLKLEQIVELFEMLRNSLVTRFFLNLTFFVSFLEMMMIV
jgi:hypothetical protein